MIRDSQPIHNLGYNLTSRDLGSNQSTAVEGGSTHSGFVQKALGGHPILAMATAMVATGVAAGVAGKFVREGGLKLGYKLSQAARQEASSTFVRRANQGLLNIRKTLDEFEGITRSTRGYEDLAYFQNGVLTTGYRGNELLKNNGARSISLGFTNTARSGQEWMWRDQFQQSLVKQARRLPYELPAFYAVDKTIGKKMFGNDAEPDNSSQDKHWYNPVSLLTTFAKDITKTAALQMGGFMIPVAFGSAVGKGSINFYHKSVDNINDLTGAKRGAAESVFFLQGALQKVGQDTFDILGKGMALSMKSSGGLAAAWGAFSRPEKNPVQTLYANRHGSQAGGQSSGPAGSTLSKRERARAIATTIFRGNNQRLDADALADDALMDLMPGYKRIKNTIQAGRSEYNRRSDAIQILEGTKTWDEIVGSNYRYGSLEQRQSLANTVQQVQSKANSPLTRVTDFLGKYSNGVFARDKDGKVFRGAVPGQDGRPNANEFTKSINRQVYRKQLSQRLVDIHGVDEKTADNFTRSLRIDSDVEFIPSSARNRKPKRGSYAKELGLGDRAWVVAPENRIGIGTEAISKGGDDFFDEILSLYNSGKQGQNSALNISGGDLRSLIAGIDDDFARGKFSQEILEKKGQTWSNIYRDYESIKGETVFKKKKLLLSDFQGDITAEKKALLRQEAASVLGVDVNSRLGAELGKYGVNINSAQDLNAFLLTNKRMARTEYGSSVLDFLGIKKADAGAVATKYVRTLEGLGSKQLFSDAEIRQRTLAGEITQGAEAPYSKKVFGDETLQKLGLRDRFDDFDIETGDLSTTYKKGGSLRGFADSSGFFAKDSDRTISGYYTNQSGQTINLNPLKNIGTNVATFLTEKVKIPVVQFNPLQLFGAGEFLAQKAAGDFQITEGLARNPFLGNKAGQADMIAWYKTGGILGSKGKVGIYSGKESSLLAGSYVPINVTSDKMFSTAAKLAAGSARTASGPLAGSATYEDGFIARAKNFLNFSSDQPGSIARFGQRLLNRRFDINNESVMAELIRAGDQPFEVGGFGRRKTLQLITEEGAESDTLAKANKYRLVDASTNETVAGHSDLMEAFTRFADTTLLSPSRGQGVSGSVLRGLTTPGRPEQGVEEGILNQVFRKRIQGSGIATQNVPTITSSGDAHSIINNIGSQLDEELVQINNAFFEAQRTGKPADHVREIRRRLEAHDSRKKAYSRLQKFLDFNQEDFASQSTLSQQSPSIVTKMDEFKSELSRFLIDDALVGTSDTAQLAANLSVQIRQMVQSGRIGATEAAEAQASILGSLANAAAFKTYTHEVGSVTVGGESILHAPAARFAELRSYFQRTTSTRSSRSFRPLYYWNNS